MQMNLLPVDGLVSLKIPKLLELATFFFSFSVFFLVFSPLFYV